MTEEEKKNVCDAAKFALNVFWKGKAHVDIINPHFFGFHWNMERTSTQITN